MLHPSAFDGYMNDEPFACDKEGAQPVEMREKLPRNLCRSLWTIWVFLRQSSSEGARRAEEGVDVGPKLNRSLREDRRNRVESNTG